MPALFDKLGVRFAYPDNWLLEEQDAGGAPAVSVSSPEGAFWCLTIHPASADVAQVAKAVLDGVRNEYDNLDIEAVCEPISGQETLGYDVNFYCLDLLSTAQIRGFQTERATYTMLWQAEDCEFERVRQVFEAMTTSLIRTAASEGGH